MSLLTIQTISDRLVCIKVINNRGSILANLNYAMLLNQRAKEEQNS